jgi:uncharacterized protein DUF2188
MATMADGDGHVVRGATRWRIEIDGSKRAQSTHTRRLEAWEGAKQIARRRKAEAYLHGRNGQIRERAT